ncbi:MAG: protein O-mannosyl-transferase family [bacterium]
MSEQAFHRWNKFLGWSIFLIALIVYTLTVEPTVSFWDAGEYILTSSNLEVGHPPGAPLFQMLGAFFSLFAFGDPTRIGWVMNMMSAVASAFTILFMFWSLTLLLRKLIKNNAPTGNQALAILSAAAIGSLSFTFTDSFWFNAVETEVYAMATLIMAVLFYLALRWESDIDKPRGNRWLLLICFIVGLSFGVHFMGLLTLPAIGLIYFFKKYQKVTVKNFIVANIAVVGILAFIFKVLLPTTLKIFSWVEVGLVNNLGLPFHSGTIICGIIFIALFYFGLKKTRDKQMPLANTLILCLLFIFIGFSSWIMLPIRANADVVINENDPSSARELLAYYNLEQYPKTYLFYGPLFSDKYAPLDEDNPYKDDRPKYERDFKNGKYVVVNEYKNVLQNFNSDHASILPRMWSPEHAENYINLFTGYMDFEIKQEYRMENELRRIVADFKSKMAAGKVDFEEYETFLRQFNDYIDIEKPSFIDNLGYMIEYQFGYMYWRYFMWNFVGRQDDIQGKYDNHGEWISGLKNIDAWHLGMSQDNLPSDALNNPGRNTYFFLPLILGLIGFFFLFNVDRKWFWVLLVFFLFTGMAIQFYTNVRPFEPRERDYSVVGSFYVFALFIGLGVYGLFHRFNRLLVEKFKYTKVLGIGFLITFIAFFLFKELNGGLSDGFFEKITYVLRNIFGIISATLFIAVVIDLILIAISKIPINDNSKTILIGLIALTVPALLAANNWDDHDRSGRRTAHSMAVKYLESCAPNSILFTIGDNDSFPLWYAQEIEGIRRDVRVVNTSLFQTDWYIDQMKRRAYDSDPIPSQLTHDKYRYGTRDYIMKNPITKDTLDINTLLDFITSDDPKYLLKNLLQQQGEDINRFPSHYLKSNYVPTEYVALPVNKENVIKSGIVKEKDAAEIVDTVFFKIKGGGVIKNRLLMLDIVANNNWERPIYFTGGAFGDDDYIWMKDYLQLDGMCYKLVPIKTPIDKRNPFDMGRVDSDLMYDLVKDWDWGNSGKPSIYHDPESRKNGITYRGNMARLIEALINENKLDKAEEIADIAMEKMPVDIFGYYTLLEPYVLTYYDVGATEKARALFKDVAKKYQENLVYYSGLSIDNQERFFEEIYIDIERYRGLVDAVIVNDKEDEFIEQEMRVFNDHLKRFKHFMGDDILEEETMEAPQVQDSVTEDSMK